VSRLELRERERGDALVVLTTRLPACATDATIGYATRSGALARIDGHVAGAFDREHRGLVIGRSGLERELTLEVERRSLPTNGLPSGAGLRWWLIERGASPAPEVTATWETREALEDESPAPPDDPLTLWGHSHLDVAWLWSYSSTRRKAMRTFANAANLIERDESFVFAQSQPQLYDFVRETDSEFFGRIERFVRAGRFDPSVAALWVEPDCNLPSGESLLRQMLFAHRFCTEAFGISPSIAWLPDTFGFARTLPSLLAHAGIAYFGTTKLQWNDTSRFPHPQFRWRGPDGSEVVAANLNSMDGGCAPPRVATARLRGEPLIVGYGDGGGGPTAEQLRDARGVGRWESPAAWFARLHARRDELPLHDDELYLQYHRGTYTTHHDVKAANAALERRLAHVEEAAAWCVAVRAPAEAIGRMATALRDAWRIVLRNQFHDVLPGTSVAQVYADVRAEYARAGELLDLASTTATALLPRPARPHPSPVPCRPRERAGVYDFENGLVRATVSAGGAIVALASGDGVNLVECANLLTLYRDRPARWEAWNVDAGYERTAQAVRMHAPRVADDGLEVSFDAGRQSRGTIRVALLAGEPFLRVDAAVAWRERRRFLRVENRLRIAADEAAYGAPHGVVTRSGLADTPERRAQYEVPGQRFAFVRGARPETAGVAILTLDTYGWSGHARDGAFALGHSLLRGTVWPDPGADLGEHRLSWAYLPAGGDATYATIERAWLRYAGEFAVRLFESDDPAVLVVACKQADDGDGVVVRVRECDGRPRPLRIRCGARMRAAQSVDALERPANGDARIEAEWIVSHVGAFGLRSFRVRF
jgi:alpha-mannosidase